MVIRLIAVRTRVRDVRQEPLCRSAGFVFSAEQGCTEGAVGSGAQDVRLVAEIPRLEIDRPSERCGADRCRGPWTPIDHGAAEKLSREKRPGMVCGIVRIVERNPVEHDVVLAVLEPAEERLRIAHAGSVRCVAEHPRYREHHLAEVGGWRGVVLDELFTDDRLRAACGQQRLRGRARRRCVARDRDVLGDLAHRQFRDLQILRLAGDHLHAGAAFERQAGRRYFDGIGAGRQSNHRESPGRIRRERLRLGSRLIPNDYNGSHHCATVWIDGGPCNGAGGRLRVQGRRH